MKHPHTLENLVHFLAKESVIVTAKQIAKLSAYYSLLLTWSRRQNLFAAGDKPYLVERHFLPSFYFFDMIRGHHYSKVADIGSGAGFPGIILQIMMPEISISLIDSSRKKCLFLHEVCESLNLNANIRNDRVENLAATLQKEFGCVVARFVGDLDKLWPWVKPILLPGGSLFVQKGDHRQYEVPQNASFLKYWPAGASWISFSSLMSTKIIIEVGKHHDRE